MLVHLWRDLRLVVGLHRLWNYDLRRSLATHTSNELNYSDAKIDAILGHEKTSSLGHYLHVSFDAMTGPIQHYADWLCGMTGQPVRPAIDKKGEHEEPVLASTRPAAPPLSLPVIAPLMATNEEDERRLRSLSEREYETLSRFGQGQSCTDIAADLGISIRTISSFRARILRKLHFPSTRELIHYAVQHEADLTRPTEASDEAGPPTLSEREREVLAWFAHGQSNTYIGARLGIPHKTVATFRARLLDKLQLTKTTDLIRYAIEHKADRLLPVQAQPTSPPVMVPPVMSPMMSAPVPIVHRLQSVEREEWPG